MRIYLKNLYNKTLYMLRLYWFYFIYTLVLLLPFIKSRSDFSINSRNCFWREWMFIDYIKYKNCKNRLNDKLLFTFNKKNDFLVNFWNVETIQMEYTSSVLMNAYNWSQCDLSKTVSSSLLKDCPYPNKYKPPYI